MGYFDDNPITKSPYISDVDPPAGGGGGGMMVVHITYDYATMTYSCDQSYEDIVASVPYVMAVLDNPSYVMVYNLSRFHTYDQYIEFVNTQFNVNGDNAISEINTGAFQIYQADGQTYVDSIEGWTEFDTN